MTISLKSGSTTLIRDLTVSAMPCNIVTVTGPSGIGKSTLLAYIGGHLDGDFVARGRVRIGPRDLTSLPPEKRRIDRYPVSG